MKREAYATISDEMGAIDFHHTNKEGQKAALDDWIDRGLRAASESGEPFTDWEKVYYRDTISHTRDGLFWMAKAALYRAIMPVAPKAVWPIPADIDFAEITLDRAQAAAEWLRNQPVQRHPVFMRQ